jgi:cellulose 1,4-beta-cellobiosidase
MLSAFIVSAFVVSGCKAIGNPFTNTPNFYVNPAYQEELSTSISTASGTTKNTLETLMTLGSAYWIDKKNKITGNTTDTMEGILIDASSKSSKQLVVFIVYDLPNRDCHAKASNGEICCSYNADLTCNYDAGGDCSAGISEYTSTYIDPMYSVIDKYDEKVEIVLIIEPDSLPNLATNTGDPHCGSSATANAYKTGTTYAISKLSGLKTSIYIDAAHGGWLGWEDNMKTFVSLIKSLNVDLSKVRGFSTNVANYQPLGSMCPWQSNDGSRNDYCLNGNNAADACCSDPCKLLTQWNQGNNELNYVNALYHNFVTVANYSPSFIIDTGRNGVESARTDCSNWCNIRGAGVGRAPTAVTGSSLVDAFFWLKTPGESDGCTQTLPDGSACRRYDASCASSDSLGSKSGEPYAPEAGMWFDFQIKQLADNAHLTV